ncbi:hypothetical protein [Xanthocytophaga flava]|uniref:hypothetical protein n=1 Tax=Xanthocytophaga flava TaxID=3048013 RepID=UPI0028D7DF0C|nr:hypothetical protein [Xanthocytophaga flavus]
MISFLFYIRELVFVSTIAFLIVTLSKYGNLKIKRTFSIYLLIRVITIIGPVIISVIQPNAISYYTAILGISIAFVTISLFLQSLKIPQAGLQLITISILFMHMAAPALILLQTFLLDKFPIHHFIRIEQLVEPIALFPGIAITLFYLKEEKLLFGQPFHEEDARYTSED